MGVCGLDPVIPGVESGAPRRHLKPHQASHSPCEAVPGWYPFPWFDQIATTRSVKAAATRSVATGVPLKDVAKVITAHEDSTRLTGGV